MNHVDPFLRLLALTGDLEPGEAGSNRLHLLRRRLAASLREQQKEAADDVTIRPPDPRLEALARTRTSSSSTPSTRSR